MRELYEEIRLWGDGLEISIVALYFVRACQWGERWTIYNRLCGCIILGAYQRKPVHVCIILSSSNYDEDRI